MRISDWSSDVCSSDLLGYGKGYAYDHDTDEGFSGQDYFPDGLPRQTFYRPVERGFARDVRKRPEYWEKLRLQAQADKAGGPKRQKVTDSGEPCAHAASANNTSRCFHPAATLHLP